MIEQCPCCQEEIEVDADAEDDDIIVCEHCGEDLCVNIDSDDILSLTVVDIEADVSGDEEEDD